MPDSIDTDLRLSPNDVRVLQALRAGPMQSDELFERMNGKYALAPLLKRGFIEESATGYRITPAGRAACPNRRSTERTLPDTRSADSPAPASRHISTISMHDAKRIVAELGELKLSFQLKKQEATMRNEQTTLENEKPRALRILEYIEAHPGCCQKDITAATCIAGTQAYIKYHIKYGKVIMDANGSKNTFRLASGYTALGIYQQSNRGYKPAAEDDAFSKAKAFVNDFAQTMQEISQEAVAETEPQKQQIQHQEAKVLKLDLPERHDAEFCIKTLLKLMPHSHIITIRKANDGGGIAEIDGRTLAEQIAPDITEIDVVLSALNTINQAMAA